MNASIDTSMDGVTGTPPPYRRSYSDSFGGVRGQLAVGLDNAISPMLAIGVVGRVDYWSAYPTFRSSDFGTAGSNNAPESASHDHLLAGFVGIRLVVTLGR